MRGIKTISDDPFAMSNIRKLRGLRQQQGLTQNELGILVNLSGSAVGSYEIKKYIPQVEHYNKLAEYFNWPRYKESSLSDGSRRQTIADDPVAMKYIQELQNCRESYGLTQKELGELIGDTTQQMVSNYEKGHVIPSVETYNALANCFSWPLYSMPQSTRETLPINFPDDISQDTSSSQKINAQLPIDLVSSLKELAALKSKSVDEMIVMLLKKAISPYAEALSTLKTINDM